MQNNDFNASRKYSTLHKRVARVLKLASEGSSVRNVLYNSPKLNQRCVSTIAYGVVNREALLDHLISNTALHYESDVDQFMLKTILYYGFFHKKSEDFVGSNRIERLINSHLKEIKKCLNQYLEAHNVTDVDQLDTTITSSADNKQWSTLPPRYVRVNTLKGDVNDVIKQLKKEGFELIEWEAPDYTKFIRRLKSLKENEFIRDFQFEDLLVFHSNTSFLYHHLYETGVLVLQDKASLLPVWALNPKPGRTILDCCAAPGLKTTHLAAYLNNDCTILSSDRSEERIQTMYNMLELHGATCVSTKVVDFTQIDPNDENYSDVKYIVLDPSCSGSGMVKKRLGEVNKVDQDRLRKLGDFQAILLKHALSFPNVKKVSYSTCSLYWEENESVVLEALNRFGDRFKLAKLDRKEKFLPYLDTSVADLNDPLYNRCLKAKPERDLTNGFFVAVFVRRRRRDVVETELNDEMEEDQQYDLVKSSKRQKIEKLESEQSEEVTEECDEHKVKRKKAKKSKS